MDLEKNLALDDEILGAGWVHESQGDNNDNPLSDPAYQQLCTDCGIFFSQQHPHMCLHKLKPHSCYFCGRRFIDLASLNFHNRMHNLGYGKRQVVVKTKPGKRRQKQTSLTKEKPYHCPKCFKLFSSVSQFRVKYNHKGVPKFNCNACRMQFQHKSSFKAYSTVHTGERPYVCPVCLHRFSYAGNLNTHIRLHTGERPYKCQHCDRCFNQNMELKLHVQRYHTGGSERRQEKNKIKSDTLVKKSRKVKNSVQEGKRGKPRAGRSKGKCR